MANTYTKVSEQHLMPRIASITSLLNLQDDAVRRTELDKLTTEAQSAATSIEELAQQQYDNYQQWLSKQRLGITKQ